MAWTIVGDRDQAVLACNTGMTAFGPLWQNFSTGDASAELREFANSLDRDPRKLHDEGELREEFIAWKINRQG